jgi:hypothetical protein
MEAGKTQNWAVETQERKMRTVIKCVQEIQYDDIDGIISSGGFCEHRNEALGSVQIAEGCLCMVIEFVNVRRIFGIHRVTTLEICG